MVLSVGRSRSWRSVRPHPTPLHRGAEPGVQTQLRLARADADVFGGLVEQWSAPSSALVNTTLRLSLVGVM